MKDWVPQGYWGALNLIKIKTFERLLANDISVGADVMEQIGRAILVRDSNLPTDIEEFQLPVRHTIHDILTKLYTGEFIGCYASEAGNITPISQTYWATTAGEQDLTDGIYHPQGRQTRDIHNTATMPARLLIRGTNESDAATSAFDVADEVEYSGDPKETRITKLIRSEMAALVYWTLYPDGHFGANREMVLRAVNQALDRRGVKAIGKSTMDAAIVAYPKIR